MPIPSLLSHATPADLQWEPFPHVVIKPALDDTLVAALIEQYPSMQQVTGRTQWTTNTRYSYSAHKSLADPALPDIWREMVTLHTSQSFLQESLRVFAAAIRQHYPGFEQQYGALDALSAGTRVTDDFQSADVLLDAQICINTPVTGRARSVRGGHVDRTNKLFSGLFYLRHPDDTSRGGDLELYRFRDCGETQFNDKYIDDRWIETAQTVKYEANTFVYFLNGPWALHGVTPRTKTAVPRLFFNLVSEVPAALFDLSDRQTSFSIAHTAKRLAEEWMHRMFSPRSGA